MDDILILLLGGIPIAVNVLLGVQGLKVFGFANGETAPKAAIVIAAFFGVSWLAGEVFPVVAPYIVLVNEMFLGVMTAGLFYEYIAKPFFAKVGIDLGVK